MAKAEIKTKMTDASVEEFLDSIADEQKRADSYAIIEMMKKITGETPKMWGPSIIGFGETVYRSPATGREVDWMKLGFSPRKANLTLYVLHHGVDQTALLDKLGKHTRSKGCLYIKRLSDVDKRVLEKLISSACKKEV